MVIDRPLIRCKSGIYRFCKKKIKQKYKNNKANRKLNRVGKNVVRFALQKIRNDQIVTIDDEDVDFQIWR